MSNILNLNEKLFQLLDDMSQDKVDIKKAQAMVNVSNAINNNAKLMLQAAKMSGNQGFSASVIGTTPVIEQGSKDTYQRMTEFAHFSGYSSIPVAIGKMGKADFEKAFKNSELQGD